jgi:hypothetical protein
MGAGWCAIAWARNSLNLGIDRVYHLWMEKEGISGKLSNINADEY